MKTPRCELCANPVAPGTEHPTYHLSHQDCIDTEHNRRFARYLRRNPEARLMTEPGRPGHWTLADALTARTITDPRTQIPAHRRYTIAQAGGVVVVRDWWGEEPDRPCPSVPEAVRLRDTLRGRAPATVDRELTALAEVLG